MEFPLAGTADVTFCCLLTSLHTVPIKKAPGEGSLDKMGVDGIISGKRFFEYCRFAA